MNIRNEIKAQIIRAGMTMQEVVDLLSDEYGWSDSVSNLSAKLQRESIRYKEVKLEIEVIEEWVEQREEMNDGLDAFIALTQKYVDVEELTQTIVNEYIKKIVVYAPDKSSGKRKQKVKIFFNFVDDVDIPVISEPIVTQTTYERRKTA